jgi:hypothetical protein
MWDDDRVGIPAIDEGLARLTAAVEAITSPGEVDTLRRFF